VIYEFRTYHYSPDKFSTYRQWALDQAVPYFQEVFELEGFWTSLDIDPQVLDEPLDHLGAANITWVLRWENMEQRDTKMAEVFQSKEWAGIFERLPGGFEHYLRREARFMESLVKLDTL
jgi:hypothetical protein